MGEDKRLVEMKREGDVRIVGQFDIFNGSDNAPAIGGEIDDSRRVRFADGIKNAAVERVELLVFRRDWFVDDLEPNVGRLFRKPASNLAPNCDCLVLDFGINKCPTVAAVIEVGAGNRQWRG